MIMPSGNTIGNPERWKGHSRTVPFGSFVASEDYRCGWERIWGDCDKAEDGSSEEAEVKVGDSCGAGCCGS